MPTLPTLKKSSKKNTHHNNTDMRKLRQDAYNQTAWRKLREVYLKQNPLCEECIKKNKVTPATSVHHRQSPFSKGQVNQYLFLDYENLESVCHECHSIIHAKENNSSYKTVEEQITYLETLLNDNQ